MVGLPDAIGHEASGHARLYDRNRIESGNPMREARVKYGGIGVFGRVQATDRISRNYPRYSATAWIINERRFTQADCQECTWDNDSLPVTTPNHICSVYLNAIRLR